MAIKLEIARIPIFLKNADFLKILNPIETQLISPFLKNKATNNFRKKGFLVDFKAARALQRPKGYKPNPKLIKKIRSLFPAPDDRIFRKNSFIFTKGLLSFYLLDNQGNTKKVIRLLNDGNNYIKIIFNRYSSVIFDAKLRNADIVYIPVSFQQRKSVLYRLPYHLITVRLFLRLLLEYQKNGIVLHASCVEMNCQGLVFIGPGNSGKSTVVRLLSPDRILSDETTVIRKINNTYKVFPNPWWNGDRPGDIKILNPQRAARLKALFFIEKSEKTSLRRLKFKEALAMLIYRDRSFQQAGLWDNKMGIKAFYTFSQDLLNDIPAFELSIKKGARFRQDFTVLLKQHL